MGELRDVRTLNDLFFRFAETRGADTYLQGSSANGAITLSSREFVQTVFSLSQFWRERGLAPGDRIAIISENRPEWHVTDFACSLARLILVPVYPTLSTRQKVHLLAHSGAAALVVSTKEQWDSLQAGIGSLPDLRHTLAMDHVAGVDSLLGVKVLYDEPKIRDYASQAKPDDVVTIVYTSGTTGTPKGAQLTHGNLISDLAACLERFGDTPMRQALSVLPLSHILERLLTYGYFARRVPIAYGEPGDLRRLLNQYRPDVAGCVPRILEKIREAVIEQGRLRPAWQQALSRTLFAAARKVRCAEQGASPGLADRLLARAGDTLVFRKISRHLGGVRTFICGGAWLDPAVERFFRAAGFAVYQGYGLTETSPVIALNPPGRERPGTVGPPLDGVEVRIAPDGEILVRGPNVTSGYYRDPIATAEAFQDGWFHTGDLGSLDADGYLSVQGRKKDIVVLSTGKNVSCAAVQQAIARSEWISASIVVGHGRKFPAAFLVPNLKAVKRFAAERRLPPCEDDQLLLAAPVLERFGEELRVAQSDLAGFERIERFFFLPERLFESAALLTPTKKVRCAAIDNELAYWIDLLYATSNPMVVTELHPAVARSS